MSRERERKRRYRRPSSWEIHSAAGLRVPGGAEPTWWADARPTEPEPGPAPGRPDTRPDLKARDDDKGDNDVPFRTRVRPPRRA
jgi:hypothetical protein